jgi:hypothetical protein
MQGGWIKIDRGITNHWIWQDPERFKWWIDLLLMAAWEDKEVIHDSHKFILQRGQIIASVAYLATRWKKNHQTIRKYLDLLQNEEMLTRKTLYRQTPIITICSYDKYQLQDHTEVDRQTDTIVSTIADTIVDSIVYTNKEYKEIKNINNIVVNNACVREEELIQDMLVNHSWLELMAMRYKLSQANIITRIQEFSLDCQCRGITHTNDKEIKQHFNNWLLNKNQQNGKHTNNKSSITDDQLLNAIAQGWKRGERELLNKQVSGATNS